MDNSGADLGWWVNKVVPMLTIFQNFPHENFCADYQKCPRTQKIGIP